jgi:large subunit ribosomal protein L9
MNVILLDKVENLGNLGDLVSVRPGFGRNFLIPSGKAVPATEENRKKFEARRAELENAAAEALATAQARAAALDGMSVTIPCRVGDEGKLFGSVGTADIAAAFAAAGQEVRKQEVRMPEGQLRKTGIYNIELHLHPEVNVEVKVELVPES